MKTSRLVLCGLLLAAAWASNAYAESPTQKPDTLRSSVVTGTRVSVLRDALPAPVTVVPRATIADSDESAVMPVLMEQVPGLFVTSRNVSGYGVSGGISLTL